ncbi:C40 family peptidase [Falsibacillus albus]|uniref:NlpC/P60 family protein n=1 Tax=Falsibacillus albus TaxID=2478915 RepID=A0A3L7JW30_9BACI|nr:C40 family peptidase [Falsibacillus albus]RLQ94319.1 NlpC/P60 family protein [Falsibacillus albus]
MLVKKIISTGLRYRGIPYVFNAPPFQASTFDCSSFIQYIFQKNGIKLPRNSRRQFMAGKRVGLENIREGDLLFFTTESRKHKRGIKKIGHVALYIGRNKMLHTTRDAGLVHIAPLDDYWRSVFIGAKRII